MSPESTSTSPAKPASAALRGAHRVAGAERLLLHRDGDLARRRTRRGPTGEATTTSGSAPLARPASSTQSTMRRPSSSWKCFGTAERMRVPRPPAMTTAASGVSVIGRDGWGARIRTWDRGTKTRCLTAWLRPTAGEYRLRLARSREAGRRAPRPRARRRRRSRSPCEHPERERHEQHEHLRDGEDPAPLANRVEAARARPRTTRRRSRPPRERRRPTSCSDMRRGRAGPRPRRSRTRCGGDASRSQRPERVEPCSIACVPYIESTVPRGKRDPDAPETPQTAAARVGVGTARRRGRRASARRR